MHRVSLAGRLNSVSALLTTVGSSGDPVPPKVTDLGLCCDPAEPFRGISFAFLRPHQSFKKGSYRKWPSFSHPMCRATGKHRPIQRDKEFNSERKEGKEKWKTLESLSAAVCGFDLTFNFPVTCRNQFLFGFFVHLLISCHL